MWLILTNADKNILNFKIIIQMKKNQVAQSGTKFSMKKKKQNIGIRKNC
jgi:hypothetical protein